MRPTAAELVAMHEDDFGELWGVIDHACEDDFVVTIIAVQVEPERTLEVLREWDERADGDVGMTIALDDATHRIPLTVSRHDRYVVLSSLAWLLRDTHTMFIGRDSLGGDTNKILTLPNAVVADLRAHHAAWLDDKLQVLEPGFDHFNNLAVPHLGDPAAYAAFAAGRGARDAERAQAVDELKAMLTGSLPADADPALRQASVELQEVVLKMQDDLVTVKRKPWWKFW
jgi:hypothetical protein